MVNLVQVPWQPEYYLTPDTLAYLVAASERLGTQLQLTDGWRSYAAQKALRDYYFADPVNHPFASDPDTGQRNHMRGAAFDLVRTDPAVQDACRAVGLIRDASESWHWNNPNWQNMPIIPSLTDTSAAGTATPLTPQGEEDDMTPDEKQQLNDTAAMVKAMWQWMGGGTPTTQFYDIKKQLSGVQASTDDLANGKGAVHTKLDQLLFITNDAKAGIRQVLSAVAAVVTQIAKKLGA